MEEDNDTLEDLIAWVARAAAHDDEALEARMEAPEGQLSCPILRRSVCCCRDSFHHHPQTESYNAPSSPLGGHFASLGKRI